jgi:hypothetical protein
MNEVKTAAESVSNGEIVAKFDDYRIQLFELYQRARYQEETCLGLARRANRTEIFVKWSVLVLVGISLITGSMPYLNRPPFTAVWAILGALATLFSAYSLIVDSGAKRSSWFALATKFRAIADEFEFFTEYVKRGKISEKELLLKWEAFSKKLAELIEQGGVEMLDYAAHNEDVLREKLSKILKQEGRGI